MDTKIQVQIYGQSYSIKAGADPEYIKRVAVYVDLKMREIASGSPTVDSLKIAVLAALNITDEYFQLKSEVENTDQELRQRTERLQDILSAVV